MPGDSAHSGVDVFAADRLGVWANSTSVSRAGRADPGREVVMPTYIMLTTLTAEGAHTVHANPDRLAAVNDEVATFGCKVVAQYAVLGAFDFVTIIEAPDNETIAHLSVDLGSRGTAKIQTLPAIPIEALTAKLKGEEQLGR